MKRHFVAIAFLLPIALAGCSSSTASGPEPAAAAASSQSTTVGPSASTAPSARETPISSPVAGGTATDFCGAFKTIMTVGEAPSGDMTSFAAKFQAAAADMRKHAPAEIDKAAKTYAEVMDAIGKAAASGTMDEASLSEALSKGMEGNSQDIGTVAMWVAKNCSF